MATVASNQLGVYAIDGGSISPLTTTTTLSDGGSNPAGVVENEFIIKIDSAGAFVGLLKAGASSLADYSVVAGDLCAAATTTTLDASNTINEVAARNGVGGSTNYIASGAFSWNFSVDGLIDLTANAAGDTGTPITIVDLAKESKYVIVRFTTKIGNDTGGGLGDDSGVVSYIGQALIESASLTGGVDDIATYSATFRGYGDLYKEIAA
jgi:hypothetical protein